MTVSWTRDDTSTLDMRHSPGACPWCSSQYQATFHAEPCPRVKSIEFHPDGGIKQVELREAHE